MDWLLHNPLADMYGPTFLLLYALVIVITIGVTAAFVKRIDRRDDDSPPAVPRKLDPYEIAYLRGGVSEVIRVAGFNVLQAGALEIVVPAADTAGVSAARGASKRLAAVLDRYALHDAIDQEIHRYCAAQPRRPEELLQPELIRRMTVLCEPYHRRMIAERLLASAETDRRRTRLLVGSLVVVLSLGGYKLAVALWNGHHNVLFLLAFAAAASTVLATICRPRRITKRGSAYIGRLQRAYPHLRRPEPGADHTASAGVFGLQALSGTPYGDYSQMFSSTSSASSCASASASASGSSCGGGGGSCGGGGCGGCGGGS